MPDKKLLDEFLHSVDRQIAKPSAAHPDYMAFKRERAIAARDYIVTNMEARAKGGRNGRGGGRPVKLHTEEAVKNRENVRKSRAKKS